MPLARLWLISGITDALQGPSIELHDSTGATIASNDNWNDTQQNEITASGKAPPNNLESAILHTFPLANSGEFALLLDQLRDKRGPAGLVGSAKSATIVAIKVFMKPI